MPDLKEVFSSVSKLHRQTERILSFSAGMESRPNLEVEHNDEVFLLVELQTAINTLVDVQKRISYLSRPIKETSRLWRNGSGQYETTRGYCYRAGSPIEVLITHEGCRTPYWTRTHLEYDGKDYYLAEYPNLQLKGMTVRVREGDQP